MDIGERVSDFGEATRLTEVRNRLYPEHPVSPAAVCKWHSRGSLPLTRNAA